VKIPCCPRCAEPPPPGQCSLPQLLATGLGPAPADLMLLALLTSAAPPAAPGQPPHAARGLARDALATLALSCR
jgi:hypothetical protein